jgi:putative spermidine/putrescine transport system ATP-binding protein
MQLASMPFSEIRLDRMSRSFGALNALREITLSIKKGEFIALLGPSGCGKSTALNCIAGLLATTGGGIYIDDKRIDQFKPEDRGFGMVFQNYALFPHMSVRQNIGFGLKMRSRPRAEIDTKVDEALALVRLQGQAEKLPGQLSGGQQQRVAIARAIVIEPPLVLMDEPLSNLDAKLRLEMRAEIRRIHNQMKATTIYVTHDQDEALSLADRIVVLRDGTIRQVGTPHELYDRPAHLDVAEFMGFRNRFVGKVVSREGERATVSAGAFSVSGTVSEDLQPGASAALAVRPDDLTVVDQGSGGIPVTVEAMEYRGREYVGIARTADGLEIVFHANRMTAPGNAITLSLDPSRALVFPA